MRRCYKHPWPIDQAMTYINAERGRHFDPAMVDAFMEVSEQIRAIRQALPE